MTEVLYPLLGLFAAAGLLMLGAELLIKGCKLFATMLRVSEAFAGITLMSVATSSPEIFVSLGAHLSDHTSLSLGNLTGSNIANILLVYGVGCLFFLKANHSRPLLPPIDLIGLLFSSLIFFLVIFFQSYTTLTGAVLFLIYSTYIGLSYICERNGNKAQTSSPRFTFSCGSKLFCYTILGALILYGGSELIIYSGTALAQVFQISESAIGLTAIAIGTSLPELVVLLLSAKRMSESFVVANIVGSNIFNITLIPGIMFLIYPTQVTLPLERIGLTFFVLSTALFAIKSQLAKKFLVIAGIGFLTLYGLFIFQLST